MDGVEIDPARLTVRRDGRESRLRAKTFRILLHFLERPGQVVTRDELLACYWQGIAVTEDNLTHSITEIRKALGDSPRGSKFLETIPKVGYRLAAAVEQVEDGAAAPPPAARRPVWRIATLLAALAALALLGAGAALWRAGRIWLPRGDDRRTVAVMFFENRSGNPDLDWLREGLADMLVTGLARSSRLTLLGRDQLSPLRRRKGVRESDTIRLPEALDIARAGGADDVVLGAFTVLPMAVRLDVQLYEARSGRLVAGETVQVDRLEHLLLRLDPLSVKLAARLGAKAPSGSFPTLAEASTTDLEAYRCYSLGLEAARAYRSDEAVQWFTKAAERDPTFAMAQARIGYAYIVSWGRPAQGKQYLEKAFQRAAALTARDRLQVHAWYALANEDYDSAIKAYRRILSADPADLEARLTLGHILAGERRLKEALAVLDPALDLDLDPDSVDIPNQLAPLYFELNRKPEAFAAARRYAALVPQEPNAHDSLGLLYQWNGEYPEALAAYRQALKLKPDFAIALVHLGNLYFQTGRYRDAIREYEESVRVAPSVMERGKGLSAWAWLLWRKGDIPGAKKVFAQIERPAPSGFQGTLLHLEPVPKPEEVEARMARESPYPNRGARGTRRGLYAVLALAALQDQRSEEAIAYARRALEERPPYFASETHEDVVAACLFRLGRYNEALAEYERVLAARPNMALARYYLGITRERQGDSAGAARELRRFLTLWQDADPDIPELADARRR
jgi:tetratricopeptide (TPR) repeat protein